MEKEKINIISNLEYFNKRFDLFMKALKYEKVLLNEKQCFSKIISLTKIEKDLKRARTDELMEIQKNKTIDPAEFFKYFVEDIERIIEEEFTYSTPGDLSLIHI